jgi:hypothetical protein
MQAAEQWSQTTEHMCKCLESLYFTAAALVSCTCELSWQFKICVSRSFARPAALIARLHQPCAPPSQSSALQAPRRTLPSPSTHMPSSCNTAQGSRAWPLRAIPAPPAPPPRSCVTALLPDLMRARLPPPTLQGPWPCHAPTLLTPPPPSTWAHQCWPPRRRPLSPPLAGQTCRP